MDSETVIAKIMVDAPDFMDGGSSITKAFIMAMIKTRSAIPTIDAVPVVRCKDCRFLSSPPGSIMFCEHIHKFVDADWFCADGERK